MGSLGVWTLMDCKCSNLPLSASASQARSCGADFGEPQGQPLHAWPHVSCDFGQYDIAGYPKPHAYWYRANWLQGFGPAEPGRPALPFKTVARILELPAAPGTTPPDLRASAGTTIQAVTTAPSAELFLDGVTQGVVQTPRNGRGEIQPSEWSAAAPPDALASAPNCSFPINASGVQCHDLHRATAESADECAIACCGEASCDTWQWETSDGGACWVGQAGEGVGRCGLPKQGTWLGGQRQGGPSTPFRNATLVARDGATILATHSLFAPSDDASGYKLQLTLDVPSASTGTGSALLLDGRDTALVRAAIVDGRSNDALVSTASDRITWRVVSGPGRVAGISSGNKSSHEWMKSSSVNAFLGLARGLFRVTQDCTSAARAMCSAIDADAGRGPTAVKAAAADCGAGPIVVEAAAPGLAAASISIPVSADTAKDGVMAAARATGSGFADGFSYLDSFVG